LSSRWSGFYRKKNKNQNSNNRARFVGRSEKTKKKEKFVANLNVIAPFDPHPQPFRLGQLLIRN